MILNLSCPRIALVSTVCCRVVCLFFFQCGGSCKPAVFSRFAIQFCDRYCGESGGRAETIKLPTICFLLVSVYCMRTCRSARQEHFDALAQMTLTRLHRSGAATANSMSDMAQMECRTVGDPVRRLLLVLNLIWRHSNKCSWLVGLRVDVVVHILAIKDSFGSASIFDQVRHYRMWFQLAPSWFAVSS